jgi:hypothetical protein
VHVNKVGVQGHHAASAPFCLELVGGESTMELLGGGKEQWICASWALCCTGPWKSRMGSSGGNLDPRFKIDLNLPSPPERSRSPLDRPSIMAAPPPHDQHDYQSLLSSLLQQHLFPLLSRATKLSLRGVSVQLRDETDRCFKDLVCPFKLKGEEQMKRLRTFLGRMLGLNSLELQSLEAVDAVFKEDGTHACGPQLQDLTIHLSEVSPLVPWNCMHASPDATFLMHAFSEPSFMLPRRLVETECHRLSWPLSARGHGAGCIRSTQRGLASRAWPASPHAPGSIPCTSTITLGSRTSLR